MVNQPLNSAFAGRQNDRKKSSRKMIVLGALIVGLAGTVGAVFAATVNINAGNPIVFAQGVEEIITCDTDNAVTQIESAFNAATNSFSVTQVTVSGLDNDCSGKTIEVFLTDGTATLGSQTATVATSNDESNSTIVTEFVDGNGAGVSIDASLVTDVAVEIRG